MTETSSKKKLSLKEFIWLGFNYTVGIGFIGNYNVLSNAGNPHAIGANAIWVYLIIGFVAGNCAWAFARLAKIHNSDSNGAAYIYVRTNFGRFLGWMVGFMQYVALPFVITIQILMLIRGTFSQEFVSHQWYTINWGNFTDLYLDLIGIVIYLVSASAIFGGIKLYKKLAHTTGAIKWGTASFLVLAAIVLAISNGSTNFYYWTSNSPFSITGFMNTFTSCFFFFAGFEIFATAGKNIVNPEKNIGKGITLIILISTIFYIIISIIFFLAYSKFEQNMNMGSWIPFQSKFVRYGGPIIMIISGIAMKINIAMQNALYGGTALQPLSKEGYISSKLFKLNQDGIPVKAALLNLLITGVIVFLWLIVPDIIKGVYLTVTNTAANDYQAPFNISSLTSAASVITIFIYLMVLSTVVKLFLQKKLTLNWYERIVFPIVFSFLIMIIIWHYYELIDRTITNMNDPNNGLSALLAMLIEIIFMLSSFTFVIVWYFAYYLPKYKKRLKKNPNFQNTLDANFAFNEEHMATLVISQETEVIN